MRVAVFSSKPYDRAFLEAASNGRHELTFIEARLRPETATLLHGFDAACVFVQDAVTREVLTTAAEHGCKLICLRCAGFNNVDLAAAQEKGIEVARVPAYSPEGVAEHAAALILTLNRKIHRAYNRVREFNFSLNGLMGFDLHGKTVGVYGTGKIGVCFCRIMRGFGCEVLAYDVKENPEALAAGVQYVPEEELFARAHVLSLHCPLLPQTHHLIRAETLARMRDGIYIVNTSRGKLIDTHDLLDALRSGKVGAVALDVYEEEEAYFFEDLSGAVLSDDELILLTAYPNVLITSHQGFFTREAMTEIARVTVRNLDQFAEGGPLENAVRA